MKFTAEMALGGMIHIPSFTEIGSGVQKLFGREGCYTYKHTQTAR
jgi:hypothetical protein